VQPRQRLRRFRHENAGREYQLLRRVARRLGYHLVRADYYSPIPDLDALPPVLWSDPAPMPGVAFDLDAQLRYVVDELGPLMAEQGATPDPPGPGGYHYRNQFFNALDADVLYATVRRLRPPRVFEVGSGFSTLVIENAAARNRAEGDPLRHVVLDPFPSPVLEPVHDRLEVYATAAQEIPRNRFDELSNGDLLFIDSTHTVKPGSDVVHLLLGVVPTLPPGVVVHVHDFFRPFEYPTVLMDQFGVYWQEHHLLQALLVGNPQLEILCANHALARLHREQVREVVPGLEPEMEPSSLWLRRR
jgi:Methyltransferase domain